MHPKNLLRFYITTTTTTTTTLHRLHARVSIAVVTVIVLNFDLRFVSAAQHGGACSHPHRHGAPQSGPSHDRVCDPGGTHV